MEPAGKIGWYQKEITLPNKGKGCFYITDAIMAEVGPQIEAIKIGTCHLLIKHTSASIALNEVHDPSALKDMDTILSRLVPEGEGLYIHTEEGMDDMPSHAKTALMGVSQTIPITDGKLNRGTWQGVWLCEHRGSKSARKLVVTINGLLK